MGTISTLILRMYRIVLLTSNTKHDFYLTKPPFEFSTFFPEGWTWAQGISDSNNASFSIVGGNINFIF